MSSDVIARVGGGLMGGHSTADGAANSATEPNFVEELPREPLRHTVHLPPFWSLLRDGGLRLAEATLVPLAVFYFTLHFVGLRWALVGALAWSYLAIAVRLLRRERVSG